MSKLENCQILIMETFILSFSGHDGHFWAIYRNFDFIF